MIRTANAIKSIDTRYQRVIRARGYFPGEITTLKRPLPPDPVT